MSENSVDNEIVLFGQTNFRNKLTPFGIKMKDRRRHIYIIGKTGLGKSELEKLFAIQDIQAGRGMAFVDPHGDTVEDLLDYIPEERIKDVIYINPADLDFPVAFNVMEQVDADKRHLVADGVMNVFKKIWVDVWSPRMEYILNHTILALLETPDATLLGINRMLAEKEYRNSVIAQLQDPTVKAFWTQEFAKYADKFATEATAAIQNKVGQFTSSALIRNIVGQPHSSIDMRKIMDEGKILLVNISKGRIGEDASRLLGGLIITKLQLAAMSRVDMPEKDRRDFVLIVDEFQNFATSSFANILSEARKYHLSLIVAHQYVAQLDETVRDAIFGNVGTIISFRVGAEDAEALEKELSPEFMATDIVNLGMRQIYLKLLIDGIASRAFSAMTMDRIPPLPISNREKVIEYSRAHNSRSAKDVEKAIADWYGTGTANDAMGRPFSGNDNRQYDNRQFDDRQGFRRREDRNDRFEPRQQNNFNNNRNNYNNSGSGDRNNYVKRTVAGSSTPPAVSLDEAFKRGAVDFKGRKIQEEIRDNQPVRPDQNQAQNQNPQKIKPEIDVEGLRKILDESLKK
jgi:hypothetical protein